MTGWVLMVDSSDGVVVQPEWDFKRAGQKIEDSHRARSGKRYVYKWGSYDRFEFSLEFVSSADACKVNSWWGGNTDLLFVQEGQTDVSSVRLVNDSRPLESYVRPYMDYYSGKLELETY